jgi:curved DNA-binding protein CbpA
VTRHADDPFAALGLDPGADLTDDDVRAAWRRIAAATHPDRADGGDPVTFAIAAAAYADLRTTYGRGEARASGLASKRGRTTRRGALFSEIARVLAGPARIAAAIRRARTARLAVRVMTAACAAVAGVIAAGPGPAGPALVAGATTWLLLTARHDLHAGGRSRSAGFGASGDRAGRIGGPR